MPRTITVKGVGKVSARPNYIVLSMTLESRNIKYEVAMEKAAESIDLLNEALAGVGFGQSSIKTTNFRVQTDYSDELQKTGRYKRSFDGYVVNHNLKVEFDFESERLKKALSAVGSCLAHPRLSIAFTVKDSTAINEEMLRSATVNAKRKAEILCEASEVELGSLLSIDYNWGELNIFSDTRYYMNQESLDSPRMAKSIEIEPDNIDVSDSATFIWEIK